MRSRPTFWILLCLLCLAGAWLFFHQGNRRTAAANFNVAPANPAAPVSTATKSSVAGNVSTKPLKAFAAKTNELAFRLSNTTKFLGALVNDPHAILLVNALIDTRLPLNFSIPKNLQAQGDPGAYIVQARGPIDGAFRAMLARSGAQIVSYIPNNSYLVTASAVAANEIAAGGLAQAVIPYEPYYKISVATVAGSQQKLASAAPANFKPRQPTLLELAVEQKDLPASAELTLGLFAGNPAATIRQIKKLGGNILATDNSPFGPVVRVQPPANWTALADLPGVQIVEPYHQRVHDNDLSRPTVGVSLDSVTTTNYLNLSGSNVIVEVDDSGVDTNHPDFDTAGPGTPSRLFFNNLADGYDTDGHGTFVAGEIAGDGFESMTVTNAEGSIITNLPGPTASPQQFRGKAPLAKLFVMNLDNSDEELQEAAAQTNALISNNSWGYGGDNTYDLAAASYDAATRDALPAVTGSQPVLFVFAAGNDGYSGDNGGNGDNDGFGGDPDTIDSPGTAKNVITVGALEQERNITNYVTDANGHTNTQPWAPQTDTSYQVAYYSSRGNVGIDTEGTYGRYKPDVVSPGTFVISTRSYEWDTNSYYNPIYDHTSEIIDYVDSDSLTELPLQFFVYNNAVQVTISAATIGFGTPQVDLPIYVWPGTDPNTATPDLEGTNNVSLLPSLAPDTEWACAVSNTTDAGFTYDLIADVRTTNDLGNYYQVLETMNDSIGTMPEYYRYESGTSMSAADVSGVLALMQDFFINHSAQTNPSPALLKAMLINGARPTSTYNFQVNNAINYEGWGLINLPDSLPSSITNVNAGTNSYFFFADQSPTNALATGDSQTYFVTVAPGASGLPLRVTLAWTDPPGNPAAAIKLVNDLALIVTNFDDPTNPIVYFGNDIPAGSVYNAGLSGSSLSNSPPWDSINNVQNIFLPPLLGTNYSVTVFGRGVNVNAVTAQTNNFAGAYAPNIVQDYALVISCGEGEVTNAITVTNAPVISNPTNDQDITFVLTNNAPLLDQFVGANSPLIGTNQISAGTNDGFGANAVITIGQTNQWHFYVVTNTLGYTNAAFITFLPPTLSIPRMGVFADSPENATRPEADIDLYVAGPNDPYASGLTNLDPNVISNCVNEANGDAVSLSRGGTEFVAYNNSKASQVYYIGVKSEDQEASEYGFLPVFSLLPFSQLGTNGAQTVNGVPLPVDIPDGSPAHPGAAYIFGLALFPMEVQDVIVSNEITHQNIGDLIGTLSHNGKNDVLNNHISVLSPPGPPPPGPYDFVYDDSQNPAVGSQPSDGPGSLTAYTGGQAIGPWLLTEVDNSLGQTGSVTGFSMVITPHIDPSKQPVDFTLNGGAFYYDYIDVPVGAVNLTVSLTNITGTADVQMFIKYGAQPTTTVYDYSNDIPASGPGSGNSISIGLTNTPPLEPGRYYITIFNAGAVPQSLQLSATITLSPTGPPTLDFNSAGVVPLSDDAVTTDSIDVTNTDLIASVNVGLRVEHPRISDLVFHLISPDGTRYLLMENRGGASTNGAGASYFITNTVPVSHNGNAQAYTNTIDTGETSGSFTLNYDLFVLPDTIDVYYQGTNIFSYYPTYTGNDISGTTNIPFGPGTSTEVTIVINQGGNTNYPTTAWTYTITSPEAKYAYLTFTEDTNLTTTPIKFAPTPFTPVPSVATSLLFDSFETNPPGVYTNGSQPMLGDIGEWTVTTNQVTVVSNVPPLDDGTNYLALQNGVITTVLPTVIGQPYVLEYAYLGSGVTVSGGVSDSSVNNFGTNWQTHYVFFTAAQSGTTVFVQGADTNSLLDAFRLVELPPNLYYLPEQSLDPLVGQSPAGTWQLEVQDDRAGAFDSNNPPALLSWQLQFVLASTNALRMPPAFLIPNPTNLTMDDYTTLLVTNTATNAYTNLTLTYSLPDSPPWASIDTNGIITLAPGMCDSPGTNTIITIVTDNGVPPQSATNSFQVVVIDVNTAPFWTTNTITNYTAYELSSLAFDASATDTNCQPDLTYSLTSTVAGTNLPVINVTNGIVSWAPDQTQDPSNYVFTVIATNYDQSAPTNQYLTATNFFTVTVLPPLTLTNSQPQTNSILSGEINFYEVTVPPNADFATNILLFATNAGVNFWFSTNSPPTITNPGAGDTLLLADSSGGTNTIPVPVLVPGGTYYLGVQNTNSFTVGYGIEVDFDLLLTSVPISSITVTTNGDFQLEWFAPPYYQFQVEWTTNLLPPVAWTTNANGTNFITSTNTTFIFVDTNMSSSMLFYRLLEYP